MNYLAHAYLSFDEGDILLGNFIADTVKNKASGYADKVRQGIRLHHLIDNYTDDNLHFKKSISRLDLKYTPYGGVIVDMFYDHFLAAGWQQYHKLPLQNFVSKVYKIVLSKYHLLPLQMKLMFPHMMLTNWLLNYRDANNLRFYFRGLSYRTRNTYVIKDAAGELKKHYSSLNQDFFNFMNDMIPYVKSLSNY